MEQQSPPAMEPDMAKRTAIANSMMMVQQSLYDHAAETDTLSQYINAILFMVAVVMAHSSEEQAAKMLQFLSTKAVEIRAAKPKENVA